jgi:ABC-type glycerol-3-phosphate transport system substrate-binding protein
MNLSSFQIVVIGVFVSFIVVGVGAFAIFGGMFGGSGVGPVTIWGTVPQRQMDDYLGALRNENPNLQDVGYVQQEESSYESLLLNAMASGASPDLFLVTQEQIAGFSDKIIPIPYSTFSQSQFVSSYIDESQLLLSSRGAFALPLTVDPLVMYWNRDLFASAGVANAPEYWNDFLALSPKMTSLDSSQNLRRSAVAMGAWQNVLHGKEILSTLFMQAGEFLTGRNQTGDLVSTFGQGGRTINSSPAESALRFYTEFANPGKTTYSWNRSLPRSDEAFVGGITAVYFGYASEANALTERNPNLRFSIAMMPQLQGAGAPITYGTLTSFAIPRSARNVNGAAIVAQTLTGKNAGATWQQVTGLPSARRDVFLDTSASVAAEVFSRSALIARGWIDPSPRDTDELFKAMIESVISGRSEPATAISEGAQEFERLISPSTF